MKIFPDNVLSDHSVSIFLVRIIFLHSVGFISLFIEHNCILPFLS